MAETKKQQVNAGMWATMKPFVNGGTSGMMSISVIQPVDMVKVRLIFFFWSILSFSLFDFHRI